MQDKSLGILIIILSIIALGLVFYVNTSNILNNFFDTEIGEGLGSLCSDEQDCKNFCNNNMGQCLDYCKNRFHPLCRTIFEFKE
ncbi:hypothetical protein CMI42_02840 [Candidatus Pacearchaeota archaeon]|nr:hypothetical protein [Candidatus Pacearchaeota archaeon]